MILYGLLVVTSLTSSYHPWTLLLVQAANYYNNNQYYGNNNNNNANGNNNNYYNQNYNNNNNNNNNNNYQNQNYNYNNYQQQQGDDAAANDDGGQQNNNNYQGDDQYNNDAAAYGNDDANAAVYDDDAAAAAAANDDAAANGADENNDDDANNGEDNDDANMDDEAAAQYNAAWEDDLFHWKENSSVGFDGVSVMPVSCVNYNNGHMIKFEMFETDNAYQCHFAQIGTFVVSIAHYMRAHFNYQALEQGRDFSLPSDAGYLNCIQLQGETETSIPLYAKIGCMERETFTSTKLQLHVYTDDQCSVAYNDGQTARYHANRGYLLTDAREKTFLFSTKVNFRPPFYTCQSCTVEEISETFNKKGGKWYDDDYISQNGQKQNNADNNEEENDEDAANYDDDQAAANQGNNNGYYQDDGYVDDTYMSANDDIYRYNNNNNQYYNNGGNRALLRTDEEEPRFFTPASGQLEEYEAEFWRNIEVHRQQRILYDNSYSIDDWNMCKQVYKYGLYCDEQCRSLDAFRTDRWSGADIILLSIMCTFMAAMMLLIVAKRLKMSQRQRISYQYYENDTEAPSSSSMPGLPPVAMLAIFVSIMIIIIVLAEMKFVNETLVFAVVTCVLLFIYMLKLTLFARRKPVLLAAPKHDMYDNPLDERLFT